MDDLEALRTARRDIQSAAESILADLRPARARWQGALSDPDPLPRSPEHSSWTKRALGTGLDRRVKLLFALDPIPPSVPERPPWCRYDLFALRWDHGNGNDEPPSEEDYEQWAAGASERQADAERRAERHGFGKLAQHDPMAPTLGAPVPRTMIVELDALTELAHQRLVLPRAHLPLERRQPLLIIEGGHRYWHTLDGVDLVLDRRLCEIKTLDTTTLQRRDMAQLVRNLLYDPDDHYDASALGIYEARRGVLVWFELDEVVHGGYPTLQRCRDECRPQTERVSARFRQLLRCDGDPADERFEVC